MDWPPTVDTLPMVNRPPTADMLPMGETPPTVDAPLMGDTPPTVDAPPMGCTPQAPQKRPEALTKELPTSCLHPLHPRLLSSPRMAKVLAGSQPCLDRRKPGCEEWRRQEGRKTLSPQEQKFHRKENNAQGTQSPSRGKGAREGTGLSCPKQVNNSGENPV